MKLKDINFYFKEENIVENCYHVTTKQNKKNILLEGFNTPIIFSANTEKLSMDIGRAKYRDCIENIDSIKLKINYKKYLQIPSDILWKNFEYENNVIEFIQKLNIIDAIIIKGDNKEKVIIILNKNCIKEMR